MALLQVENLSVQFGGLKALNDVSLQVKLYPRKWTRK